MIHFLHSKTAPKSAFRSGEIGYKMLDSIAYKHSFGSEERFISLETMRHLLLLVVFVAVAVFAAVGPLLIQKVHLQRGKITT